MADDEPAAGNKDEQKSIDNNPGNDQEPSNAWIWIIAAMLVLIALFFALGGGKLLGDQGSILMVPNTSTESVSSLSDFSQNE